MRNYLLGAIAMACALGPSAETTDDRKKAVAAATIWPVVAVAALWGELPRGKGEADAHP